MTAFYPPQQTDNRSIPIYPYEITAAESSDDRRIVAAIAWLEY